MNNRRMAVAALVGMMMSLPAAAAIIVGFTGPFAPATWTTTVLGSVTAPGANGSVSATPTSVTITGGDNPSGSLDLGACSPAIGSCEIRFTHPSLGFASFSFHWSYASLDSGGAQLDQFGALIDGLKVNLSDPGGLANQSGDRTFHPLSSIGWFINCGDCVGGAASATISAFTAAVPEPGSLALFGLGLAGLGVLRRKLHS